MRRIRRLDLLVSICIGALTAGCGSEPGAPARGDEDLTDLVALPYLSWDEGADPTQRGVTRHDPERAWRGINLYTDDVREAYLMDMAGRRLHTWTLPEHYTHCEYFELLERGEIVAVCSAEGVVKVDWRSQVIWESDVPAHHDVAVAPDGVLAVPFGEGLRDYHGRRVAFDGIAWLSPAGRELRRWSIFENLEAIRRHHGRSRLDRPPAPGEKVKRWYDYYHLNTLEFLPDTPLGRRDSRFREGNLLICLRNAHLVLVLDRESMEVAWSWGAGELSFPHMPTMLPSGRLLIFDNGVRAERSRVIEVDPPSGEIVWSYTADPPSDFYSRRRGSSQRLPNGNTLICESEKGRAFEVTPDGEIVWEFWNPEVDGSRRKRIYRLMRMALDEVRERIRGR